MDLNFLSQADNVALKYELAKAALETAKSNLEVAKQAYDDLLAQADSYGIPKAKLKKLAEDRVLALLEAGLVPAAKAESRPAESKRGRKPAAPKGEPVNESAANDAKAEAAAEHAGDENGLELLDSDEEFGEARA